jgi:hypothetical protein
VDWTNAIVAQALALAGCSASAVGKVLGDEKLNWRWLFSAAESSDVNDRRAPHRRLLRMLFTLFRCQQPKSAIDDCDGIECLEALP